MGKIYIVGLGAGDFNQLPIKVYKFLTESEEIYLRTMDHPAVKELKEMGITLNTFDEIYEIYDEDFEMVYQKIVERLLSLAKQEDIIYAVPGHPFVAEKTVQLLSAFEIEMEIIGGQSFIDDMISAVKIDPVDGFQMIDAFQMNARLIQPRHHVFISQMAHAYIASNVKLELLRRYPPEHQVFFVDQAGSKEEKVTKLSLYEIDHFEGVHNLRSLYIPPLKRDEDVRSFQTLLEYTEAIYDNQQGDVWLKTQDRHSLYEYFTEELEEYREALSEHDIDHEVEELGDLLMQVIYQMGAAERDGEFLIEDVLSEINQKVRRRHPHVFDGVKAKTPEEVDKLWQEIKEQENEN